jgi:hypothetical protein
MEDPPSLESRLSKHLALDLPVNFSHTGFNIESVWTSFGIGPHEQFSSIEFESVNLLRVVIELHMPQLLLLNTLGISFEVIHEVFDFLNLSFSISMDYASKIFHESKVSTHCISKTSELTEFRNQSNFITSASIFVDEQRLVGILDLFIVSQFVILFVASGSTLLVKCSSWALSEVNSIYFVGFLVVPSHYSAAS